MVDQLAAKWLEKNDGICQTPNIDRLQAMGTTYDNAYTTNPICCAARATIATGLSARCHGVLQNGYELSSEVPNFMQILQENGWNTSAFGKLHLLSHFNTATPDYGPYGFDTFKITEDTRAGQWLDWIHDNYPEHYEKALATMWSVEIPAFQCYGKDNVNLAAQSTAIRQDFNWKTEAFPQNIPSMYTLPFPTELSQTEWITKSAIEHIQESDKETPLYMHISYVQPHSPHCPPEEYMSMVDLDKIPEPIQPEWVNDPNAPSCFLTSEGAHTEIPDDWKDVRHYYYADIAHLDENIGKVLDTLEESGRLNNSYIFFLSDHGELLLDHGFTGKGERHYDECIRIPMIICGNGFGKEVSHDFIQLHDIFPTVLDMAGIPLPERPLFKDAQDSTTFEGDDNKKQKVLPTNFYAGCSLLPSDNMPTAASKRTSIYVESYNNIESFTPANWARTIRTNQYRYTLYPQNSGEQLFDLQQDPTEQINLSGNEQYGKIKEDLKSQLLEQIILQDYPHTPNSLYMLGVH